MLRICCFLRHNNGLCEHGMEVTKVRGMRNRSHPIGLDSAPGTFFLEARSRLGAGVAAFVEMVAQKMKKQLER